MNRIVVNFVCGHKRNDGTRCVELQLTHSCENEYRSDNIAVGHISYVTEFLPEL